MRKKINFENVFTVFKKHYIPVPLEYFKDDPYKTLISTLLSSRTRDETTFAVCKRLFKKLPDIKGFLRLDIPTIEKLIYPVGFYKTKARYLKDLSRKIIEDFAGKIPTTREELTSLPGVGRKTANLVLNRAFHIPAIAVDTHVHRISNMLGWVKTKTPEQTEKELTKILPKKYWADINRLFVSIGRQFTTKKGLEEFLKQKGLIE